jgi:hypothetical protein
MCKERKRELLELYASARQLALLHDRAEVEWQAALEPGRFDEQTLLREGAWVIMTSGFQEKVIRKVFGGICAAFFWWRSAEEIVRCKEECQARAYLSFRNRRKIDAIWRMAETVNNHGFDLIRERILADPIVELKKFRMIGDITSYHLAKNLGFDVAKPDRHLARLATRFGFKNVQSLCETIAEVTGDRVGVVDLILWRSSSLGQIARSAGGRSSRAADLEL